MDGFFEFKIGFSDLISVLAILIAGLSALYARYSWSEAKKANSISLFAHKKEIYDAFYELRMHMVQKAEFAELGQVSKFYYHQKNAKLYFTSDLSDRIEEYYYACFRIAYIHDTYEGISKDSRKESSPHIETELKLAPIIEETMLKLLQETRN